MSPTASCPGSRSSASNSPEARLGHGSSAIMMMSTSVISSHVSNASAFISGLLVGRAWHLEAAPPAERAGRAIEDRLRRRTGVGLHRRVGDVEFGPLDLAGRHCATPADAA